MAKIDSRAFANATRQPSKPVAVGNNRTVRMAADGTVICALHGHDIMAYSKGVLTLDPKGYPTVTTRNAMQDFATQITPRSLRVSFADGKFTARLAGDDFAADADGRIIIPID